MHRTSPGLILLTLLAACGTEAPRPAAPAPAKPAEPKVEAKPAPVAAAESPIVPYTYSPISKRDPFRSPIDDLQGANPDASLLQPAACNAPLCHWDVDQLHLVGIITGMSNPVAMVEDPQGIGYLVRRNSFMGKKGGRVTQIKRNEVVITEIFKGNDGKPVPRTTEVMLSDKDTAAPDAPDLLESEPNE